MFVEAKVNRVITIMKRNKALGSDGLPIEIVREIFVYNRRLFIRILSKCLKKGTFPKNWKTS